MGFQPIRQSLIFRDLTPIFEHVASIVKSIRFIKKPTHKRKMRIKMIQL